MFYLSGRLAKSRNNKLSSNLLNKIKIISNFWIQLTVLTLMDKKNDILN